MFFFTAEKQGSFFEGWSLRHFVFDSQRRHLYYSERERGGSSAKREKGGQWKKKIKITKIIPIATIHEFHLDDPHLKEADFFTLEIYGRTRTLAKDEPPLEPLLCSFTGPDALIAASASNSAIAGQGEINERELSDPFRLCELYEALRDQFAALRRNNTLRPVSSLSSVNSLNSTTTDTNEIRTIQSPRSASAKERHITVTIRCQSEGEFRRVWYVLQSVLGYDKLDIRPYRGLPPYDPRNGIPFAHVPMHIWHTFMVLDKSVFYTFLRGDLVGRDHDGNAEVSLPGSYLCITHDMVLIMRDNGTIPRWIRLQDVNTFEFNTIAKRPFFAFLTDDPSPDILFIPKPPLFGPLAIASFSGVRAVLAVQSILQDSCFASHSIRRAIQFKEANWASSVRAYFAGVERGGRRLKCAPLRGYDDAVSCLIPKVQLAQVWREVLRGQRGRSQEDVAAIPLEAGVGLGVGVGVAQGVGHTFLSERETRHIRRRLHRVGGRSEDNIVALPLDTLLRPSNPIETPVIRPGQQPPPYSNIGENNNNNSDSDDEEDEEEEEEVEYQQPGARYIPLDASLVVVQPDGQSGFGPETNVAELVNTSFAALAANKNDLADSREGGKVI